MAEEIANNYLPNFQLDKLPKIRIKSIRLENYKAFEAHTFDFTNNGEIQDFICFIGPNGVGKSTILNALQLLFYRLEGRSDQNVVGMLGKAVRHVDSHMSGIYGEDDFLITAEIVTDEVEYVVQINKNGFVDGFDHPEMIKLIAYRLCYLASYDQELSRFQLNRNRLDLFIKLFKKVTGYTIEECESPFAFSEDPEQAALLDKYVLDFVIHKPNEDIHHSECSDGEKKILKSFSTLLNKDWIPQIILVDNVEMHVEQGRHVSLIEAMRECFPESQIFTTTHSYYLSRIFGKRANITDLRTIRSPKIIKEQPWRLWMMDEISEGMMKLEAIKCKDETYELGKILLEQLYNGGKDLRGFDESVKIFLKEVCEKIVIDMIPPVQSAG